MGWVTTWSTTLTSNSGPSSRDYCWRVEYPAAALAESGTKIRITIMANLASGDLNLDGCSIGEKASSGDAWDFADTPTRITWDGASSTTVVTVGNTKVSDEITFNLDETKTYLIHFWFEDDYSSRVLLSGADTTTHYKSRDETDETMDADIADMKTLAGRAYVCNEIEVYVDEGVPPGWNRLEYTSEPPTPNAWNQVKREAGTGWKKLEYE